ncbi:RSP_2648 family PIN domain-containing protein [Paracoccus pacificus]|uniref:RSP_2648 family PIN domain-containing protein n=1 Tax=Paracoccus pacificus TaxID=1463598 RepID=A0ABW4R8G9_9RHOB
MKAVLDACVLYPTILREILADVAAADLYQPVWSPRIIGEWTRAAERLGPDHGRVAGVEAALLSDRFPLAARTGGDGLADGLDLPDPADRHVVETALASGAPVIITLNMRDFPRRAMLAAGLQALHPDSFLTDLWARHPDTVTGAVTAAMEKAQRISGQAVDLRQMMGRSRLPRLGKAIRRSAEA